MRKQIGWLIFSFVLIWAISARAQSGNRNPASGNKKNRPASTAAGEIVKPKAAENVDNSDENRDRSNETDVVADDEVLQVDTNLVTIPVQVFDRDGRFVGGLQKEDFHIAENNEPQQIEFFAQVDAPYTVALVLDTSLSARFKIDEIQTAAYQFVMNLRPQDRVLIVSFDEQTHFLSEPTSDRETLRQAIRRTRFGGGTSLYEAVNQTFARLKKTAGRKAVVLFTDGVDTTSRAASAGDNLAQAQEFDALVYPVYYDTYDDVQNQTMNPPILTPNPVPGSPVPLPSAGKPTIPGTNIPLPQLPQRRDRRDPNSGGLPGGNPRDPNARNDPRFPNDPNSPNDPRFPTDPNDPTRRDDRQNPPVIVGGGSTADEYRRGKQYLEKLSFYTGGRFYVADSVGGLSSAFDQINEDLRRQYSLGYYPKDAGNFGERRQVKVKVNRQKVAVRARDGYIVARRK